MFRSALVCCALFVASATCYDLFSGSSINEIFDRSPVYRLRRDADEETFPQCCGNDFSEPPLLILGSNDKKCTSSATSGNQDMKAQVEEYLCFADCIAQEERTISPGLGEGHTLLSAAQMKLEGGEIRDESLKVKVIISPVRNGEVDEEKVVEFVKSYDGDEYRVEAYKKYLPKCVREAKRTQKKIGHKIKCDSTAGALTFCLYHELVKHCPKNKQNNDMKDECDGLRQGEGGDLEQIFA